MMSSPFGRRDIASDYKSCRLLPFAASNTKDCHTGTELMRRISPIPPTDSRVSFASRGYRRRL
jgi:hypothetical protein